MTTIDDQAPKCVMSTDEMTDHLHQHGLISFEISDDDDIDAFNQRFEEIDKQASALGYHYNQDQNLYIRKGE